VDLQTKIEELIGAPLASRGYEVVRIQLSGQVRRTLQIMIERLDDKMITVDDCAAVSRVVSVLLDQYDPISGPYTLEVSSPGLDRPLVKHKDYVRFQGHDVIVKTQQPIDGRKTFTGQLVAVDETTITIAFTPSGSKDVMQAIIPLADIRSARLQINFDSLH
jgi:ribosome maturation factor RimP